MKFDLFVNLIDTERRVYRTVIDDLLTVTQQIEELGFDTIWTGEHHFGGEGYDIQPNPLMNLLFLSQHTERIRLGIAALVLPAWHPLRLAEDVAVLDQLTDGRVEVGIARGITDRELSNLSRYRVERRFGQASRALFKETLDIVRKAWTEEALQWDGQHYTFPRRGITDSYAAWYPRNPAWRSEEGEYIGMSIVPKPVQSPMPSLWNVGDSYDSFGFAAREGLGTIGWLLSDKSLEPIFEFYREESAKHGFERDLGERVGLLRVCVVAETDEEARKIAEPAVEKMYRDYLGGLRGRQIYADPGEELGPDIDEVPWFDFLQERGHLLVGSPETVTAHIKKYDETLGLERLLLFTWLPGLTRDQIQASLALFGSEVMPHFTSSAG